MEFGIKKYLFMLLLFVPVLMTNGNPMPSLTWVDMDGGATLKDSGGDIGVDPVGPGRVVGRGTPAIQIPDLPKSEDGYSVDITSIIDGLLAEAKQNRLKEASEIF